ncbi:MAG: hypothetical protein QM723_20910 [Myxococcaceae bacterium]
MIQKYVESGSSFAPQIDNLILVVAAITGFWFFLTLGLLIYFVVRYNEKPGVRAMYIAGEDKKEKRWITMPHNVVLVFDIVIIVMALRVWYHVKQEMPTPDATVRVIAQQWAWSFVQPGPDGKLDTADDIRTVDELHVEVDKTYHFELQARDVLHSFSVPIFRLKQDALPGRTIKGWFHPTITGGYDIQCTEICGIGHGLMGARIYVETHDQHQAWMKSHTGAMAMGPTSMTPAPILPNTPPPNSPSINPPTGPKNEAGQPAGEEKK